MGKSRTSSYIVEYRLAFNDYNPMSVLQKLDRIAAAIYNEVLNEGLKRMHRLDLDKTYQETLARYKRLLAKEKRGRKLTKAQSAELQQKRNCQKRSSEMEIFQILQKAEGKACRYLPQNGDKTKSFA